MDTGRSKGVSHDAHSPGGLDRGPWDGLRFRIHPVLTLLAESIAAFSTAPAWSKPVGALSGKTTIGIAAWLVAWLVLGLIWKDRDVRLAPVLVVSAVLLVVGFLFVFPPFFEIFAGG
jgi:hypothetical protein